MQASIAPRIPDFAVQIPLRSQSVLHINERCTLTSELPNGTLLIYLSHRKVMKCRVAPLDDLGPARGSIVHEREVLKYREHVESTDAIEAKACEVRA